MAYKTDKEIWQDAWKYGNRINSISTLSEGALGMFTSSRNNAQIADTSGIEADIDNVENTNYSYGSFDTLLDEFDTNSLARTNYTSKEIRGLDPKHMVLNTLGSIGSGVISGSKLGGIAGGIVGGFAGLGSGLIGIGIGNNKAKNKANELNKDSALANNTNMNNYNNSILNTKNMTFRNSISAYGGPLFNHSENFNNGVTFINAGGTHEENPLGGVPIGVDPNGTPNLVEEGEVIWNNYVFSNRLKPTKKQLEEAGYKNKYDGLPFSKVAEKIQQGAAEMVNDKIALDSMNDSLSQLAQMQEMVRGNKNNSNTFPTGGEYETLEPAVVTDFNKLKRDLHYYMERNGITAEDLGLIDPKRNAANDRGDLSFLRYTPVLGNAITLLSNLKKPDYKYAEAIEKGAKNIQRGNVTHIGDYVDLPDIDTNAIANTLLASSAANLRANQNLGLNASQVAGLNLASNYKANRAIGDALLQSKLTQSDIDLKEMTHNSGVNRFNAEMDYRGLGLNQRADEIAYQGIVSGAQLRNQEEMLRDNAIGKNVENLTESLAGIGSESYWARAIKDNPYIHPAYMKNLPFKNGGCLTRNRRRR